MPPVGFVTDYWGNSKALLDKMTSGCLGLINLDLGMDQCSDPDCLTPNVTLFRCRAMYAETTWKNLVVHGSGGG